MCNLVIDDLDEYPSLGPLFVEKGLTASELDQLLTRMETVITLPDAPSICRGDAGSIHGDAVIVFADMVKDHPAGPCLKCQLWH